MSKALKTKVLWLILLAFFVLNQTIYVFSNENLYTDEYKNFKISMNGKLFSFPDVPICKYENELMVALRTCAELTNGYVEYDPGLRQARIYAQDYSLTTEVYSNKYFLNSEENSYPVTPLFILEDIICHLIF